MNLERRLSVSSPLGLLALALVLAGCTPGGLGRGLALAPSGPLVVAEPGPAGQTPALSPTELAARPEPRSAAEVAAIEAELELVAKQRGGTADPREIAALEARAAELQRLAAAAAAGPIRR